MTILQSCVPTSAWLHLMLPFNEDSHPQQLIRPITASQTHSPLQRHHLHLHLSSNQAPASTQFISGTTHKQIVSLTVLLYLHSISHSVCKSTERPAPASVPRCISQRGILIGKPLKNWAINNKTVFVLCCSITRIIQWTEWKKSARSANLRKH